MFNEQISDLTLDVINEISLSNVNENKITTTKLYIDKPSIIITIPDITLINEKKYIDTLINCGFLLSNCNGIISDSKNISVYNKKINKTVFIKGKDIYYDLKKQLTNAESKYLKTTLSPKFDKNTNEYYFYDDMSCQLSNK